MKRWIAALFTMAILGVIATVKAQDCFTSKYERLTNDYFFAASSDQGAVGDAVAVDILVTINNPRTDLAGIQVVGCYDSSRAELLGEPQYSDFFDQIAVFSSFRQLRNDSGATGFLLGASTNPQEAERFFPSDQPFHVGTVYFRLKGQAGDSFQMSFCDDRFVHTTNPPGRKACYFNRLYYIPRAADPNPQGLLKARSTRHVSGLVRITPGEPTRPNPPSLPPLAKIYPQAPTAQSANIRFGLSGTVVRAGATQVPLGLYVTSNYEFSGFAASLRFPVRYIELVRVDEHSRPGVVRIDNQSGHLGIFMANSRRRVGREGERVQIATIYFNVKEAAREVTEIVPTFEGLRGFLNWLAIHHENRTANPLPIVAEVEPLVISNGLIGIQRDATYRGDVNLDYSVDLTDAVVILRDLFQGTQKILCAPAADFNEDGSVNISDPVGILQYLFLGGPPRTLTQNVFCDG